MSFKSVLFDLDGTIIDSGRGITNAAAYALDSLGYRHGGPESLKSFVGPPLKGQFMSFCGLDENTAELAIKKFREYYRPKGIHELELYDGIKELLDALDRSGKELIIATSKPEAFAVEILSDLGIAGYFKYVVGGEFDGSRTEKDEVIEYILDKYGIDRKSAVMVGDRKYDIIGAKKAGLKSIGVLYGFGDREELMSAGADWLVESPKDIAELII